MMAETLTYVGTLFIGFEVFRSVGWIGVVFISAPLTILLNLLRGPYRRNLLGYVEFMFGRIGAISEGMEDKLYDKVLSSSGIVLSILSGKLQGCRFWLALAEIVDCYICVLLLVMSLIELMTSKLISYSKVIVVRILLRYAVGIAFLILALILLLAIALPLAIMGTFMLLLDGLLGYIVLKQLDVALSGKPANWLESWLQDFFKDETARRAVRRLPVVGLIGVILITVGFILRF